MNLDRIFNYYNPPLFIIQPKWMCEKNITCTNNASSLSSWLSVKNIQSRSGITPEWKGVDNKGGEQPWPQLVHCVLIYCHICGCVFQEDWIVTRSSGEEWYRLIGVRIEQVKDIQDVIDVNLWTKELGCNYWSTYTKSGIEGVQVTSLHRDPIGVDNRSLGVKN